MKIAWQNITAGDREAYSEAYLLLYERFYKYGSLLTLDVALVEDAIQEVLLTLWTNRQSLLSISNPDGYFYTMFRRSLFKKLKTTARLVTIEMGEWEPDFAADVILVKKEASAALQKKMQVAIDTLTSRQREAIYLRFYEGLSYEEVASTLDISIKATYKVIARALAALKDNVSMPLLYILLFLRGML